MIGILAMTKGFKRKAKYLVDYRAPDSPTSPSRGTN